MGATTPAVRPEICEIDSGSWFLDPDAVVAEGVAAYGACRSPPLPRRLKPLSSPLSNCQ
jgi:hypothetical protein